MNILFKIMFFEDILDNLLTRKVCQFENFKKFEIFQTKNTYKYNQHFPNKYDFKIKNTLSK